MFRASRPGAGEGRDPRPKSAKIGTFWGVEKLNPETDPGEI